MMIWSSLCFSSLVWSVPKTLALPSANVASQAIAPPPATTTVPPVPRSPKPLATTQRQRHRAAALLPLQPLQATIDSTRTISPTQADAATSNPFKDLAIADTVAQNAAPAPSPPDSKPLQPGDGDPELGIIRLQVPKSSPSAPTGDAIGQGATDPQQTPCASGIQPDPELGCLPLQSLPPPPPPRQPAVYLLVHLDYFRSSNVFSAVDPVDDGLVRPGLTLFTAPAIGRNTYFVGSIDGNLIRYNTQSQIDYNELRFRAGIFQRLSPTMFGELGWSNQQLFIAGSKIPGLPVGTRFLNDHALRLELSRRDQLNKRLALNTFYQFRLSFADPDIRSRLLNSFIASFSYDLQPNLQVGLDYQFALANFTAIRRDDQYHQLAARLTYTAFRNTQFNVFVGYSFGNSSDPLIDFSGLILGVSMTVNLGLF